MDTIEPSPVPSIVELRRVELGPPDRDSRRYLDYSDERNGLSSAQRRDFLSILGGNSGVKFDDPLAQLG